MWKDLQWLILDSETTGLKAESERIIEVGAVMMKGCKETFRYSTLVQPGKPLPEIITKITGITDADLKDAPTFPLVLPYIDRLINACDVVVAYNEPFDRAFYGEEYKRANCTLAERHWIDPLVWVRKIDGVPSNKLVEVAERRRIKVARAHRADGDADMTAQLLIQLLPDLPDDLPQLMALQTHYRRQQDAAYRARRW